MTTRPHGKKGLFAANALAKVMSGDMTTAMTVETGVPGYDPVRNVMRLPGIPAEDLPDHILDRYLAYIGHEAAERGRSTWMPKDPRWADKPALMGLVNAINDARIDLEQGKDYPGFGMKMRAVRYTQAKRMVKEYRAGNSKPSFGRIGMLCVFIGEGLMTVPQAYKLFPTWAKFIRRGEHILANLDVSTEERCIEQAIALHAALQPPQEAPPKPNPAPGKGSPKKGAEPDHDPLSGDDAADEDLDAPSEAGGAADESLEPDNDEQGNDGTPQASREDAAQTANSNVHPGGRPPDNHSDADRDDAAGAQGAGALPDATSDSSAAGHPPGGPGPSDGGSEQPDSPKANSAKRPGRPKDGDAGEPRDGVRRSGGGAGLNVEDDGARLDERPEPTLQDALLEDIVADMFKEQRNQKISTYTFDPSQDTVTRPELGRGAGPLDHDKYARSAQVLVTKMRQVLTAPAMKYARFRDKGELDERSIGRFVAGDDRVMRRRIRQDDEDVAVALSWDESSSMSGLIGVVRNCAYTWNEALGRLDVPTELLGWGSVSGVVKNAAVYRSSPLAHHIYKSFDEKWNDDRVLTRLNRIQLSSGTPTAEGLAFAAQRLGRRPEVRRILFFATDGKPGVLARGDRNVHYRYIETVLRRCAFAGIEVIGFGIRHDISQFFPVSVRVDDAADFQSIASERLMKILQSTRRRVA